MEAIILASVIGAGYFFKQKEKNKLIVTNSYTDSKSKTPNGLNIYQSNHVDEIKRNELSESKRLYDLAKTPSLTGVIPPHFNSLYNKLDEGDKINGEIDDTFHPIEFKHYTSDKSSPILENVFINPNSKQLGILNNIARNINILPTKEVSLENRPMFKTTGKSRVLAEEYAFGSFDEEKPESLPMEDIKISSLTGLPINVPTPSFGSHVKETFTNQNTVNILEKFTGTESTLKPKTETNINGLNGPDQIYGSVALTSTSAADLSRYIPSRFRQNEKPIAEEYVSHPIQGSLQDLLRPEYKKLEDLVVNPKISYEARLKSGNYPSKRANLPSFYKHTPDILYTDAIDRSQIRSDILKGLLDQDQSVNLGNPQRENQSIDYNGNVGNSTLYNGKQGLMYCEGEVDENGLPKSCVSLPFKSENVNNYTGNLSKIGTVDDFGRKDVQLPNTNRITTSTQYIGSINGNKSGTQRLADILPVTLKETLQNVDNSGNIKTFNRSFSDSVQEGINNVNAKTTLKEDLGIITNRYTSQATKNIGLGYLTNKVNAKMTLKEILSNQSEYTGNPSSQDKKYQESRDQYNTIHIKSNKETTMKRNSSSGPQRFGQVNDKDSVFINNIRSSDSRDSRNKETNRINMNVMKPNNIQQTIGLNRNDRNKEKTENRFESGLHLDTLKNNPYNHF
jgi:hypothetical protein